MIALALLLQAAPVAAPPEKFSILADRCAPVTREGQEVVVCGNDLSTAQRLPLPDEVVPNRPVPSNPYLRPTGALAAEATPCAATQWGCQVGFGPPIGLIVGAVAKGVGDALKDRRDAKAKARDGDRRVAIDLDATAPAGRIEP